MIGRMKKGYAAILVALLALAFGATAAFAAVTFDPATGTGFVGKGDVQLIYGWNNQQLQANAGLVQFRVASVEETSWLCRHNTNPNAEDSERFNTTTTQGLVDEIARDNSKGKNGSITGFNILRYDGDPTVKTEGTELNRCDGQRHYVEGSTETNPVSGGVQVSIDGTNWFDLA